MRPTEKIAYLIKADGEWEEIQPSNGTDFSLKEMYNLIGCDLIEIAYPSLTMSNIGKKGYKGTIFVIDEEGALKEDSEWNWDASRMYGSAIFGNVIWCVDKMVK